MTVTLFAIPKAFVGQFDHIQKSAIESWTRLDPKPEIILFGDDAGTADVARQFGLRHEASVARNDYGTPRVNHLFARAEQVATNDLLCYINSDIILTQRFMEALMRLDRALEGRPFLGVARKTSLPIKRLVDFSNPRWAADLADWAARDGCEVTYDSDFFAFRRSHFESIPPFAIGRCYWSSWFMWDTRRRGLEMVDMSNDVLCIEPRHDYSHALSTGGHARLSGVEYEANRRLFRGCRYYTTVNATHILTEGDLSPAPPAYRWLSYRVRFSYWVYFLLKARWYPYSVPLIVCGRALAALMRAGRTVTRRVGGQSGVT